MEIKQVIDAVATFIQTTHRELEYLGTVTADTVDMRTLRASVRRMQMAVLAMDLGRERIEGTFIANVAKNIIDFVRIDEVSGAISRIQFAIEGKEGSLDETITLLLSRVQEVGRQVEQLESVFSERTILHIGRGESLRQIIEERNVASAHAPSEGGRRADTPEPPSGPGPGTYAPPIGDDSAAREKASVADTAAVYDKETFPDVIPLQNVKTGEMFELRRNRAGKNEYSVWIQGKKLEASKISFEVLPECLNIKRFYVGGAKGLTYKYTSQGIGLTILQYFAAYCRDNYKNLRISNTVNYGLIRLCSKYISRDVQYEFVSYNRDRKYKYCRTFVEVDWLTAFGPISIDISDAQKWIWYGKFSLEGGNQELRYVQGSCAPSEADSFADRINVTHSNGEIVVKWEDSKRANERVPFNVRLQQSVNIIVPVDKLLVGVEEIGKVKTGSGLDRKRLGQLGIDSGA